MPVPKQKPGSSRQDYETPEEFMEAVRRRFGPLTMDIAASEHNCKADFFWDEETDALSRDWNKELEGQSCWLNPPYKNIKDWVKLASEFTTGSVIMLIPASIGSEWFKNYVHNIAYVVALNGRITFVGESSPYPKDCMLCIYTPHRFIGFDVWDWRKDAY